MATKKKNPFWGIECQHCDTLYDDEYTILSPDYHYSNGYEDFKGNRYWECGKCVKARADESKREKKEIVQRRATSVRNKGVGGLECK